MGDPERWRSARPTADDSIRATGRHDRHGLLLAAPGAGAAEAFRKARDALLHYRVYPPRFVEGEVLTPSGQVEAGATIAQTARIGPLRIRSAVRVLGVIDEGGPAPRFLFSYATLEGHPERGIIEFTVVSDRHGVRFSIESWSRPGLWWSRLGTPLARWYQARANRGALARMRETVRA